MNKNEALLPPHGGYRQLRTFQLAQLTYDLTIYFCEQFVEKKSRTYDQMVQAARSGVQNIAEGSQASGTSKKSELRLTNVARASLEELKLDYEDFLRQKNLKKLKYDNPILIRFKELKCASFDQLIQWVCEELKIQNEDDPLGLLPPPKIKRNDEFATLFANAALSIINITCYLLDNQLKKQAKDFEENGGFTERLYQKRRSIRDGF